MEPAGNPRSHLQYLQHPTPSCISRSLENVRDAEFSRSFFIRQRDSASAKAKTVAGRNSHSFLNPENLQTGMTHLPPVLGESHA